MLFQSPGLARHSGGEMEKEGQVKERICSSSRAGQETLLEMQTGSFCNKDCSHHILKVYVSIIKILREKSGPKQSVHSSVETKKPSAAPSLFTQEVSLVPGDSAEPLLTEAEPQNALDTLSLSHGHQQQVRVPVFVFPTQELHTNYSNSSREGLLRALSRVRAVEGRGIWTAHKS